MDLSTLLLAATVAGLFLAGAGIIAAMVALERPSANGGSAPARPPRRRTRRLRAS